mgnify:CR=1 FL=1
MALCILLSLSDGAKTLALQCQIGAGRNCRRLGDDVPCGAPFPEISLGRRTGHERHAGGGPAFTAAKLARSITNGLRIRLLYEDNDTGDQTGTGPAVDENVAGTLTSAFSYIRPTGATVEVTAPTISTGATNTFT